jgi:DNA polymerase-1
MLAHYLIEPEGRHNMDWLSAKYLNYEPIHIEELIGKKGKNQGTMRDVELEKVKNMRWKMPTSRCSSNPSLNPAFAAMKYVPVFDEGGNPLVPVLTDMEFEGVRIDMDFPERIF